MRSSHRHRGGMRLLKHAAVAMVLAFAFAGTANADLGLTGASEGLPAPVSTTVTSASSTLTDTLGGDASPTSAVLGTAQATVAEVENTLEETADATLASAVQTVEQVSHSASTTVDQTLGRLVETTSPTVEQAVPAASVWRGEPPPRAASEPRFAPSAPAPASTTTHTETVSRAAVVADGERTLPPTDDRRLLPTARASRAAGASVGAIRPAHSGWPAQRSAADAARPGAPLQRLPDWPPPGDPLAPLQALLQVPSVGALLVSGALLGAFLLSLSGGVGPRLRPAVDLLRPPDVFLPLERPG